MLNLFVKGITTATLTVMLSYLNSNLIPSLATFDLRQLVSSDSAIAQALTSQFALSTSSQDTLIIPGSRVGAVTSKTTRKDLVKLFGASRLKDGSIYGAEGIGKFSVTRV